MGAQGNDHGIGSGAGRWFTTTHWSVVLTAGSSTSSEARAALEELCRTYWYPLYAYVRKRGRSPEDAQDLTQGFFARLLAYDSLRDVRVDKGKFRSFLLAAMNHFLADEYDKASALKRGGNQVTLSLDEEFGEEQYRLEPSDSVTAETLFERRWAFTLLEKAKDRLRQEFAAAGKLALFERLKVLEADRSEAPAYAVVAAELGLSESAIKSSVSRFRQRYQETVRQEVANTVGCAAEIDDEIRHLIAVISG